MNKLKMTVSALSENEAFARSAVAAFCVGLNPTIEQINDIKTAVSEAVTNSVVHAYPDKDKNECIIDIEVNIDDNKVEIIIKDYGIGIKDTYEAQQPFYTTKSNQERSGMGFTIMSSFMSELEVKSLEGHGTLVRMVKVIG